MKLSKTAADPKTVLRPDDDFAVDYDADFTEEGTLEIRRTVWNKAYRRNDRNVQDQQVVAVFESKDAALRFAQDLLAALAYSS